MKCLKKVLLSLFAMFLVASSSTAYAASPVFSPAPSPRWSYLTMISAGMEINNLNWATISVTCNADIFDVNKVVAKCELQQLNGSWKTIKTWKEENANNYIMYDKECAVAKKYSYRLKVTAYAYNNSTLLESVTSYFDYGYYN